MAREPRKPSSCFAKVNHARRVLGLPEVASFAEVQKAYHEQSRRWHPDQHEGQSGEDFNHRMGEINAAYQTLKDYFLRRPMSFREEDISEPLDAGEWWWSRFGTAFGQNSDDSD
jgi:DnaJ-class molecular chaperone